MGPSAGCMAAGRGRSNRGRWERAEARSLLPSVLLLRVSGGLPLHVSRRVSPAALERHDVVNDVAGAGTRGLPRRGAWMVVLEVSLGRLAPLDPWVSREPPRAVRGG